MRCTVGVVRGLWLLLSCLALGSTGSHAIISDRQSDMLQAAKDWVKRTRPAETGHWSLVPHVRLLRGVDVPVPQAGSKDTDLVQALPNQPSGVNFTQYAGYVTVDASKGRALFYYFAEAPEASKKPLLLWLNGGPGCSSLGGGALLELGPFRVNQSGETLFANPYAWNNEANVLFVEAPAGVGFSYSKDKSDYSETNGDERTGEDNYRFLVNWLERFPEYKSRDFYIAGESYAGIYVPHLAYIIRTHNKAPNNLTINLKGIMVGNGLIDTESLLTGTYDYARARHLISDEIYKGQMQCTDPYSWRCGMIDMAFNLLVDPLDIYDIYHPVQCDWWKGMDFTNFPGNAESRNGLYSCEFNPVEKYLNIPKVQEALHVNMAQPSVKWSICIRDRSFFYEKTIKSTLPHIKELMNDGLRVWIYSGDADRIVSVTSTRLAIKKFNMTVKAAWRPWYNTDVEVAGFTEVYNGDLTFATVRQASHMVPMSHGHRALVLLKSFLAGGPLPSSPLGPAV